MVATTPTRVLSLASVLSSCWLVFAIGRVAAHGPLDEQITALTGRIEREPHDATLYLRRGELLGQHGDTEAALADLDRVDRLDPALTAAAFARGKLLFRVGRLAEAKTALDRFLAAQPDHSDALATRARAHAGLGRTGDAVEDYTSAIRARRKLGRGLPDDYLERARVLAGRGSEHNREALRGLDEGISELGPLVSLELYGIDLELAAGRQDAALARLASVTAQAPRKEQWLVRRAVILEGARRSVEARSAYEQAAGALEALPSRHRRTRATLDLERRIQEALARLPLSKTKETSP